MRRLISTTALVTILPGVLLAQEFELDLGFDDAIVFEEPAVVSTVPDAATPAEEGDALPDVVEVDLDPATGADSALPDMRATLNYASSDGPGGTSTSTSASLVLSDSYDLDGLGFLEWEGSVKVDDPAGAADVSASLDKVKLQNSTGQISWAIGKFPIGWGEIEGTPVLDVLNAGLSLSSIGTATDDLPGQWFATADYFGDPVTVSAFAGLDPEVSYGVTPSSPANQMEFGVKASVPIEQGQIAGYAARLLPQAAVIASDGSDAQATPYTLVGLSAHKVFGPVLVEADVAAKLGLDRATATGFAKDDRLDAALGFEYALSNTTQVSGNIAAQYWQDGSAGYFDFGPGGPQAANRLNSTYQLGLTTSLSNGDISLSGFAGGAADGTSAFVAGQIDWTLSDALSVNLGFSRLTAKPGSLLAPLDGSSTVTFGATYYFR